MAVCSLSVYKKVYMEVNPCNLKWCCPRVQDIIGKRSGGNERGDYCNCEDGYNPEGGCVEHEA